MKRKRREAATMKFRRASTLAVSLDAGQIVVYNFMSGDKFACSAECLDFLSALDKWETAEDLFRRSLYSGEKVFQESIMKLLELKAIHIKGTPEAKLDDLYRHQWQWGDSAGIFHFSIRNTRFISGPSARRLMRKRKVLRRSPPLTQPNGRMARVVALPATDISAEPFALMRKRRSRREFDRSSITRQMLADCLFAGNGIVEFVEDKDFGRLPLAMTPSGGARNPFELYAYASRVEGLAAGFYHYDAVRHTLGLVRRGKVDVPAMLGTQKWPAAAAAIILMVAHFPRTMWKYPMPIAYRVVAMEAGFIGQNIALAATHAGLSAVPSGAFKDSLVEGYLKIPAVESAVLLSMSIGRPKHQES